jgi:hypothetical protein
MKKGPDTVFDEVFAEHFNSAQAYSDFAKHSIEDWYKVWLNRALRKRGRIQFSSCDFDRNMYPAPFTAWAKRELRYK